MFCFIVDSLWEDSIPALKLGIGIPITARAGLMVFTRDASIYYGGLNYSISATGDTLYRGTEALLTNVEAIQFRYGVDNDGDGVIESWYDNNPPNRSYQRKWAIRFTMVLTSEGMRGYIYPHDSVTIEDDPPYTYPLTNFQKRKKRAFLSSIVYPQNLQPEEEL